MHELTEILRKQAAEIAAAGHSGWGNTMLDAAIEIERLRAALHTAEASLADIGDATREPGDDLQWCESRAAESLPVVRAALKRVQEKKGTDDERQ